MPPVIIAVAAAAASYAVAAGVVIGSYALTMAVAAVVGSIVSIGLSMALQAITGTGKRPDLGSSLADTQQTIRGSIQPHRIIYGEQKVGGVLVYAASSGPDQGDLNMVVVVAAHEVESFGTVWINNEAVPPSDFLGSQIVQGKYANRAEVRFFRGDQTEADPGLVAESPDNWDASHRLRGLAYLRVRLVYDPKVYQGVPSISVQVKGKRLLDPRNNATAYSTNWALAILDYLRADYGLDCADDEIDLPSFIASANLSDEPVPLNAVPIGGEGSLWQRRYEIAGTFTLDETPSSVIEGMLAAAGGALVYVEGRYRLYGGAYIAPTATLTASDFAGDIELQTKPPRQELFNSVRGVFVDPAREWVASEFPPFQNPAALAEDGEEIWRDVEFKWLTDATRAQRIARQILFRQRSPLTFKAPLRYAAIRFSVWQTIAVTLPDLGWSSKPFRIIDFSFNPSSAEITATFAEEQVAAYAWLYDAAILVPDHPDTTLIDPLNIPPPTNVAALSSVALQADGSIVPSLDITWTAAAHAFVTGHEVQWGVGGVWNSRDVALPVVNFTAAPVVSGVTYDVRVRGIAGLVRGAWSITTNRTAAADTTPPAAPTGLAALSVLRGVSLSWTNPADRDLAAIEVYEGADATPGSRVLIGETRASVFLRTGMPADTTRYYWLRARDTSRNLSGFVGPVLGKSSYLLTEDIDAAIVRTAVFASGIKPVTPIANLNAPGAENDVAVLTTNGRLYTRRGGAWIATIQPAGPAETLTSDQILSLSGAKLQDNTVTGAKVVAGSILTSHLAVGSGNEIFNSCCTNSTDGWVFSSLGGGGFVPLSGPARVFHPTFSLVPHGSGFMTSQGVGPLGAGQYMFADWRPDTVLYSLSCKPGDRLQARALLGTQACKGAIQIIFLDGNMQTLGDVGTPLAQGLVGGTLLATWTPHAVVGTAPPNTSLALFRIVAEGIGSASIPYLFFTQTLFGQAPPNATEVTQWGEGGTTSIAGGNIRAKTVGAQQVNADSVFADAGIFNSLRAGIGSFGGLKAAEISVGELRGYHMAAEEIISNTVQVRNLIVGTTKITGNAATSLHYGEAGDVANHVRTAPDGQFGAYAEEAFFGITVAASDEGSGVAPRCNIASNVAATFPVDANNNDGTVNYGNLRGYPVIRWFRPWHTQAAPAFTDHTLSDLAQRPWRSMDGSGIHTFQLVLRYWSTTGTASQGTITVGYRNISVIVQKR